MHFLQSKITFSYSNSAREPGKGHFFSVSGPTFILSQALLILTHKAMPNSRWVIQGFTMFMVNCAKEV